MRGVVRLKQDGIAAREIEGETVVLDLLASRYLSINSAGTILLDELRQGRDEDQLTHSLIAAFEIDEATARRDVQAFLGDLDQLGLLDHGG